MIVLTPCLELLDPCLSNSYADREDSFQVHIFKKEFNVFKVKIEDLEIYMPSAANDLMPYKFCSVLLMQYKFCLVLFFNHKMYEILEK